MKKNKHTAFLQLGYQFIVALTLCTECIKKQKCLPSFLPTSLASSLLSYINHVFYFLVPWHLAPCWPWKESAGLLLRQFSKTVNSSSKSIPFNYKSTNPERIPTTSFIRILHSQGHYQLALSPLGQVPDKQGQSLYSSLYWNYSN